MTPIDLDAVRRLVETTTPGPWRISAQHPGEVETHAHTAWCPIDMRRRDDEPYSEEDRVDAKFIAAARTLVPAMAEEIERLRARESCDCRWTRRTETIGEAVPFLEPCAGHAAFGRWCAAVALDENDRLRAALWEAAESLRCASLGEPLANSRLAAELAWAALDRKAGA